MRPLALLALPLAALQAGCYSVSEYRGPGTLEEGYRLMLPPLAPGDHETAYAMAGLPSEEFYLGFEFRTTSPPALPYEPRLPRLTRGAVPFNFDGEVVITDADGRVVAALPAGPCSFSIDENSMVYGDGSGKFFPDGDFRFRASRGASYTLRIRSTGAPPTPPEGPEIRPVLYANSVNWLCF